MPTIKMRLDQLPGFLAEDARKFPFQTLAGIRAAARRGKDHLRNQTPVAMGTLRASWDDRPHPYGADIVNDAPYAAAVEGGARPYVISRDGIDNLILWAMQKFAVTSDEARGIAFGVAKKLAVRGQDGRFFVRGALPALRRIMEQEIRFRLGAHRR